jgi:hypothetical protein
MSHASQRHEKTATPATSTRTRCGAASRAASREAEQEKTGLKSRTARLKKTAAP